MKPLICLLFLIFLFSPKILLSQDSTNACKKHWYIPDYVKFQFAGNIGLVSVGTGKEIARQKIHLDLFYGYVPKSIAETNIHTIAFKAGYLPFRIKLTDRFCFSPMIGIGVYLVLGQNSYLVNPSYYPKGVYPPTGLQLALLAGLMCKYQIKDGKKIRSVGIYSEIGTLAIHLKHFIRSDYLNPEDILNLSVGMVIFF